jgi:hypothetical protein
VSTPWGHGALGSGATSLRSPTAYGRERLHCSSTQPALPGGAAGEIDEQPLRPEDVAGLQRMNRKTACRMARHGEVTARISSRCRFLPSFSQRRRQAHDGNRRRDSRCVARGSRAESCISRARAPTRRSRPRRRRRATLSRITGRYLTRRAPPRCSTCRRPGCWPKRAPIASHTSASDATCGSTQPSSARGG